MKKEICVKVMCLVEHKGRLLLCKGYDHVKKEIFFRILGGGVNFGEKVEDALRREMKEELNSDLENLRFLTVIENIFTYEGEKGHEITFLYKGDLANEDIYEKKSIPIPGEYEFPAEWVSVSDILEEKIILYPSFNYKKLFSKLF